MIDVMQPFQLLVIPDQGLPGRTGPEPGSHRCWRIRGRAADCGWLDPRGTAREPPGRTSSVAV